MDETPIAKEVTDLAAVKTEPKKDAVENLVVETYEPKKSCRKCHGTGRLGFIEGDPQKPFYCNCIMKVKKSFTPVVPTPQVEQKDEPKANV